MKIKLMIKLTFSVDSVTELHLQLFGKYVFGCILT